MNNAAKGWASDDGSRRKAFSERWKNNPPPNTRNGRPKGSKNKNPYPKSEAVLARYIKHPPPKMFGGKNPSSRPEVRYKQSAARTNWIKQNGMTGGFTTNMKGRFKPINPEKYKGDPTKILYRSSWELKMMYKLDTSPDILQWSSEEISVPYRSKVDGKKHQYFPDFWIKTKKKTVLVEIKPKKETQAPVQPKKQTKKYIREVITYAKNISKWESAREYAKSRGWEFQILTEHELGIK